MNNTFFGGERSNLMNKVAGAIRLPATSFKELFERYLYAPVSLNMTKEEFLALPGHSGGPRDQAKYTPFLVPSTFKDSPSQRVLEKAHTVTLVCLDIDTVKDKAGKIIDIPARQYYDNPGQFHTLLDGLNFAVYTTAQSTPEAPRLRVMVEASGFSPAFYEKAVLEIARRIGLPTRKITTESKKAVQPMFRPVKFKGQETALEHPVIAFCIEGGQLSPQDFAEEAEEAPDPLGGTLPTNNGEDISGDILLYLRSPVEGLAEEDVRDALKFIDPDMKRADWLNIVAGLRHQFREDDETGFQLFDEWSARGAKYEGQSDTLTRWNSYKIAPKGRWPRTVRTILSAAKENGWNANAAKERTFAALRERVARSADRVTLTETALVWIVGATLLTATDQEVLLKDIVGLAKEKFDYPASLPTMRKELKRIRANEEAAKKREIEKATPIPAWAMGLCYVSKTKQIYRFGNATSLDRDTFDSTYGRYLLPSKEALEAAGKANDIASAATPIVRPQDYVLNLLQIPTAYDEFYDPREPDEHFTTVDSRLMVNTYRRTHPEPDPDKAKEAGKIVLKHVSLLIAEPEYQKTLLDFLAFMVQNPGKKIRWATLIQGAHGCGKGSIRDMMETVLGHGHVKQVAPENVFSQYNDWAYGSQLTVLNELWVAGHSRYDVMNKLKEPVADDRVSINQKFRDHREVLNLTNYIMLTNRHDAIAIEPGERRYFVLKSPLQTAEQVKKLTDSGHFHEFHEKLLKELAGGLRAWFEQYQISENFPVNGPPPRTKYLKEMQVQTASELDTSFSEILEDADSPLIGSDLIAAGALIDRIRDSGVKVSPKQVASMLVNQGFEYAGRFRVGGTKQSLWVEKSSILADLDLARIAAQRIEEFTANGQDPLTI